MCKSNHSIIFPLSGVTLIVPLVEPFLFEYIPYVSQAKEIAKKEFRRELNFDFYPISGKC